MEQVSAGLSDDAIYTAAVTGAGAFLGLAFLPVLSTVGAGIFLGASIASSATAIWVGAGGGAKATKPK